MNYYCLSLENHSKKSTSTYTQTKPLTVTQQVENNQNSLVQHKFMHLQSSIRGHDTVPETVTNVFNTEEQYSNVTPKPFPPS